MAKTYKIKGMDCVSCAMLIESELEDIGVKCNCNFAKETLNIHDETADHEKVISVIQGLGYQVVT